MARTSGQSSAPDVTPDTGAAVISVEAADGVGTLTYDSRDIGVNCGFGPGWSDSDTLPTLLQATSTSGPGAVAVSIGGETDWFGPNGTAYAALYGSEASLADASGKFTLTEPDGTTYQFYDFIQTVNPPAAFYQSTTPGGDTVTATYSVGRIANVVYKTDGAANAYQRLDYTYDPVSGNIATETLSTGTGTPLRQQAYFYYDGITSPSFGSGGDLEKVVTYQDWDQVLGMFTDTNPDTCYFRYYTGAAQGHELKRAVLASDYANALALGNGDPATASYWAGDGQSDPIASYTTSYFTYDANQRVNDEAVSDNSSAYQPTVTPSSYVVANKLSPTLTDLNSWTLATTETLPDGSASTIYANFLGQALLSKFHDNTSDADTYTFNSYDVTGNLLWSAGPSAIKTATANNNGTIPPPTATGAGLVDVYAYGEGGQPAGYLTSEWVRDGIPTGAPTTGATEVESYTYQSPGSSTVHDPLATTDYPNAVPGSAGTGVTTADTADLWSGSAIQGETDTLPAVSNGQDGSGASATSFDYYSADNLVWQEDARGVFTYNDYDPTTGLLSYTIQDIDSHQGISLPPTGWFGGPLPTTGTHVNARTDYDYDRQGRLTQTLGPMHTNDAGSWVRSATWTYYDDADHETRTAQGYATYSTATSRTPTGYTLVNPISITNTDKDGRVTDQIDASWTTATTYSLGTSSPLAFLASFAPYRPQPAIHRLDGRQLHRRAIDGRGGVLRHPGDFPSRRLGEPAECRRVVPGHEHGQLPADELRLRELRRRDGHGPAEQGPIARRHHHPLRLRRARRRAADVDGHQ